MIHIGDKTAKASSGRPSRWGIAFLIASATALIPCVVASSFGIVTPLLLSLSVSIGGWFLIFSAIAYYRAAPNVGAVDGLYGASTGAATMALLLAGRESIGQTAASVVAGAFVGAVFGVPFGWTVRALWSRFRRRSNSRADPGPHDLRDPWIDP